MHMHNQMIQSSSTQAEEGVAQPLLPSRDSHSVNRCSKILLSSEVYLHILPSKAIFLLLLWTLVVSEWYTLIRLTVSGFTTSEYLPMGQDHVLTSLPLSLVCAIPAVVRIFYPSSVQWYFSWCLLWTIQDYSIWPSAYFDFIDNRCCHRCCLLNDTDLKIPWRYNCMRVRNLCDLWKPGLTTNLCDFYMCVFVSLHGPGAASLVAS